MAFRDLRALDLLPPEFSFTTFDSKISPFAFAQLKLR